MSSACLAPVAHRPVAHHPFARGRRRGAGSAAEGAAASRARRRFEGRRSRLLGNDDDVVVVPRAASSSTSTASASPFERLESLLSSAAEATAPSDARGWRELEGTWILAPPDGAAPEAVVHFCGGAFVGASPQITYGLFLERLCARARVTIVATPFAIGFEHLRIADDAHLAFERALAALVAEDPASYADAPTFGVGHSMGSLLHAIVGARYRLDGPGRRVGNALMSFNNKPATDAVPLFAEVLAPGLRAVSPAITAATTNPASLASRSAAEYVFRSPASPFYASAGVVRELLPVLDQIEPVFMEVANGASEFVPSPGATRDLVRDHYRVPRTLLVRFDDDSIDETGDAEAAMRVAEERIAASADADANDADANDDAPDSNPRASNVRVVNLPGDHVRPLRPEPPAIADDVAASLADAGDAISSIADAFGIREDASDAVANPLGFLRAGFEQAKAEVGRQVGVGASNRTGEVGERGRSDAWVEADALAGEIAAWMNLHGGDGAAESAVADGGVADTPEARAAEAQAWIDAWRAAL